MISSLDRTIFTIFTCLLSLLFSGKLCAENLSLSEVASGIFIHQGLDELPTAGNRNEIANIGFVIGARCVAVVDSGGNPAQGALLLKEIRLRTDKPVCYVINTHVHPDHTLGNIAFKQPDVHYVGHFKLPGAIASRASYDQARSTEILPTPLTATDFVLPDLLVKDTLSLDIGDRVLTLTAWPTAHTSTDLTILDMQTQTLWLGDLLFMRHLPVLDGSLPGWIRVIDTLKKMQVERVIPGHGPVSASWPAAIGPEEIYLRGLGSAVRSALKHNLRLEDAIAMSGQDLASDWLLFNDLHKKNVATAYAAMEWDDNQDNDL